MPAPTDIQQGTQGEAEVQEFLAQLRTRFHNAQTRKAKRPRGHYKRYLDLLRGNAKIAFIELPRDLFNHTSMTSCQTSFDQNAEKLELDVRQFSVYEHTNKQRLLVNWNHPEVEAQFDKWVLANTQMPNGAVAKSTTEADKETKDKIPVAA